MKHLLWLLLCLPASGQAQERGVPFVKDMNWKQVKEKARSEGKYIFMDCHATWCQPCKVMSATVFTQPEVGAFMKDNYISLKVQIDSTGKEDDYTKSWFADAKQIAHDYKIAAFPTFLIFSPEGRLVHRSTGAKPAAEFMQEAEDWLEPGNQYYTVQERYDASQDPALILPLIRLSAQAGETAKVNSRDFLLQVKDPFTKEHIDIIRRISLHSTDSGYQFLLKNMQKINTIAGEPRAVEKHILAVMWNEHIAGISKLEPAAVNWKQREESMRRKSTAALANENILFAKVNYFHEKKMWKEHEASMWAYLSRYGEFMQPYLLNNYIWEVFLYTSDTAKLKKYLPWAKRSFEFDPSFGAGMDTYANFLYKIGRKEEAIIWERKALSLADPKTNKQDYDIHTETLRKMEKGEKTW